MITYKATGGRTIELFVPFEFLGRKIEAIVIAPLTLDHVLRWRKGAWKDSFEMLAEMSRPVGNKSQQIKGVERDDVEEDKRPVDNQKIEILKRLRYPDADRVLAIFYDMLPPDIQANIAAGEIPRAQEQIAEQAPTEENSSGFDLSDDAQAPIPMTGTDG